MKRQSEIPAHLLNRIQSDHDRALAAMVKGKKCFASVPSRMVSMRVHRPSLDGFNVESVIVPPITVYATPDSFLTKDTILSGRLDYFLTLTGEPYPLAHVFSSSGRICFGNIHVPAEIPSHSPWLPIDTLFLHNDHHTSHGGATHRINSVQVDHIYNILVRHDIPISGDIKHTLVPNVNLIANDAIWILSADVVAAKNNLIESMKIMNTIFTILFR